MQLRSSLIQSFVAIPLAALAEPITAPSPKARSASQSVQMQPRGNGFMPNSLAEDALQRRITDFNRAQEGRTQIAKRSICRGC